MRTKYLCSMLVIPAVILTLGGNEVQAAVSVQVGTPNLNFNFSDYNPPPPNVRVHDNGGRPYYMERDRRVYMEKRKKGKQYKNEKKHHEDRGRGNGRDKGGKHDKGDR
jgi:hypothetical protein